MANDAAIAIALKLVDQATAPFRNAMSQMERSTGEVEKSMASMQRTMRVALTGLAAYGVGTFAKGFIDTAASFDQMKVSLDVLTKGHGEEWFQKLNDWALKMPINTQKAVQGFILMRGMGLDFEKMGLDSIKVMTTIADASRGNEEVFQGVTLALGQIHTKGKVSAEELNQLAERGIPAYEILQQKLGLTADQMQNLGKAGIDADTAIKALIQGMNERSGGLSEKRKQKYKGLTESLVSYWQEFQRRTMDSGGMPEIEKQLSSIVAQLDSLKATGTLNQWAAQLGTSVKHLAESFGILGKDTKETGDKFVAFLTGTVNGATQISTTVTPAIVAMASAMGSLFEAYNKFPDEVKGAAGTGILMRLLTGSTQFGVAAAALQVGANGLHEIAKGLDEMDKSQSNIMRRMNEAYSKYATPERRANGLDFSGRPFDPEYARYAGSLNSGGQPYYEDPAEVARKKHDAFMKEHDGEIKDLYNATRTAYEAYKDELDRLNVLASGGVDPELIQRGRAKAYETLQQTLEKNAPPIPLQVSDLDKQILSIQKRIIDANQTVTRAYSDMYAAVDEHSGNFYEAEKRKLDDQVEKAKIDFQQIIDVETQAYVELRQKVAATPGGATPEALVNLDKLRESLDLLREQQIAYNATLEQSAANTLRWNNEARNIRGAMDLAQANLQYAQLTGNMQLQLQAQLALIEASRAEKMANLDKNIPGLADAYNRLYDEQKRIATIMGGNDFFAGFSHGMQDASGSIQTVGQLGDAVARDLKSGFADVFKGIITGADDMGDRVANMLEKLGDKFIDFAINSMFQSFSGKGGGGFGGLFGMLGSLFNMGGSGGGFTSVGGAFWTSGLNFLEHADGGWLREPVVGIGLRSGSFHSFAEREPELMTPFSKAVSNGGSTRQGSVNVNIPTPEIRVFSSDPRTRVEVKWRESSGQRRAASARQLQKSQRDI